MSLRRILQGIGLTVVLLALAAGALALLMQYRPGALPGWLVVGAPESTAQAGALEVVFVADFSGPGRMVGEDLAKGFRQALEAHGAEQDVRLIVRDDRGQEETAAALAEGAASAFQTLALIGPGSSRGYDAFVETASQGEVPVIVPVAPPKLVEGSKWIFTLQPNQKQQAELIGQLVQRISPAKRVAFLTVKGAKTGYWPGLVASFAGSQAEAVEIRQVEADVKAPALAVESRQLTAFDLIFLDLPSELAVPLIKSLRDAGHEGRIVGFGDMASPEFSGRFSDSPKEQLAPGFYSNGLFAVAPVSPDISGERSRQLSDRHYQRTGSNPSWAYAYGYDTGLLLTDFIAARKAAGKDVRTGSPGEWRAALREYLEASRVAERPTSAFTGPLIFDAANQRDTQPALFVYRDKRATPYLLQYSGQPAREAGEGLDPQSTVTIEERRYDLVPVVFSGLRFHSIDAVDLALREYSADFEVWFRSRLEFTPEDVTFSGAVDGSLEVKLIESLDTAQEKYRRMRVKGKFRFQTSPRDLVLEKLTLPLSLRHRSLEANKLRFVVDSASFNSVSINSQVHDQINRDSVIAPGLGYVAVGSLLAVDNRATRGLGDPRARAGQMRYSELGLQLSLDSATATLGPTLARAVPWGVSLGGTLLLLVGGLLARSYKLRGGQLLHWSGVAQVVLFGSALLLAEVSLFGSPLLESTAQRWVVWIRNGFMLGYHVAVAFLVDSLLWWVIRNRRGTTVIQGTIRVLTSSAIFFAAFAAFYTNVLGRDFLPILATSSVLLTVVGLALRELILDAISGISLSMDQSLKVGHWILVKTRDVQLHGVIEDMSWRNVRMRSRDDQIHFVPNSLLFQTVVTNFSIMRGFTRVEIPFEVSSRTDLSRVIEQVSQRVSELLAGDPSVDDSRPIQLVCTEIEADTVEVVAQVFHHADSSFDTLSTRVLQRVSETLLALDAMPVHKVSLNRPS